MADLTQCDQFGRSAFHLAAGMQLRFTGTCADCSAVGSGSKKLVRFLLQEFRYTLELISIFCHSGQGCYARLSQACCREGLDKPDQQGNTPLMYAARAELAQIEPMIKLLVSEHANVNCQDR